MRSDLASALRDADGHFAAVLEELADLLGRARGAGHPAAGALEALAAQF